MAALDFPASPTVGQIYTANGRSWKWDGAAWISANLITSIGVTGSTMTIYGSPIAHPDATSMTFANSVTLTAASTKTLTLNGGGLTNGLVIDASNNVGIGGTPTVGASLSVQNNITGATITYGILEVATIQSDVTSAASIFQSLPSTAAASFTLSSLRHFYAYQGTFGAGSTVSNQFGFRVESNLTGATNNYGFHSNIASGTGRYNFYANGTADNYFSGSLGIGNLPYAGNTLNIAKALTGATTAQQVNAGFTINSDVTTGATTFASYPATQATAFTLTSIRHFAAAQGTIGAGSTVTNQYGFNVDGSLIGATNNYGFYSNIASGTGRYNFYAAGTAANYFAGDVSIGGNTTIGDASTDTFTVYPQTISLINSTAITAASTKTLTLNGGAGSNGLVIDANNNVGIGTSSPLKKLDVSGGGMCFSDAGGGSRGIVWIDSSTSISCVAVIGYGTLGSLTFNTNTFGSVYTERMRIDSSGNVLVTGVGGLGYGTGSGGAVTQITSRTTGVTLNKTNGAITLVSAAGLATYQTFTVTNSTVAATDVIHVCQKSGTDKYIILVTAVAAGSFAITFATTGGVTTEQPVFNFSVIKAVTA